MTYYNLIFSVVESLFSWRNPTHRKTAPSWCRIQNPMGVATYQDIMIADKLPSIEALQEQIKLLEAQLRQE